MSRTDETRARLLEAAIEVFAERGYEGARVAEIARRAGLTTGAIYGRFTGKAELLFEALQQYVPHELERLLAGSRDEAPTELLAALGSDLVDQLPEGATIVLEAFAATRRDPEIAERMRHLLHTEDQRLAKLVDEAKADGLFDAGLSTDAIVRLAHAIGLGMNISRSLGLEMPDRQSWDAVIERVIASAAAPAPSHVSGGPPQ